MKEIIELKKEAPFTWIALDDGGEIVGEGSTLEDADRDAKKHGVEHPGFLKLPPKDAVYVPSTC